jgi:hypothetical protein
LPSQPNLRSFDRARLGVFAAALILVMAGGNAAEAQETPRQIVEKLYRPYLADPEGKKPDGPTPAI